MNYVYYAIDNSDSLAHHGIKGQRWGIRRFQNIDGTLTLEGYQHLGLNPDGSKFRGSGRHKKTYSDFVASTAKKGMVAGGAALATLGGITAGTPGALLGAHLGSTIGGAAGVAVGKIQTKRMQNKIRKLLDENGKVYVKDL